MGRFVELSRSRILDSWQLRLTRGSDTDGGGPAARVPSGCSFQTATPRTWSSAEFPCAGHLPCRKVGWVSDRPEVAPRRVPFAGVGGAAFLAGVSAGKTELYVFGGARAARGGQRPRCAAGTAARPAGGRSMDPSRSYQGLGGK